MSIRQKKLRCDFHYNYFETKCNNKAKLLFTDTSSLTYEIKTKDVHKDFWDSKDRFDSSEYPGDSKYS